MKTGFMGLSALGKPSGFTQDDRASLPGDQKHQDPELLMEKGLKVRIICGDVNGIKGSVREIVTDPEYIDVTVLQRRSFTYNNSWSHCLCIRNRGKRVFR